MENIVKETSRGFQEISINATLLSHRNIYLFGDVNQDMLNDFIKQIQTLILENSTLPINIYINSRGGSIPAGLAIRDIMKLIEAQCTIRTICINEASSMGAILFLSGTKGERYILSHSTILIHNPIISSLEMANTIELEAQTKRMLGIRNSIDKIIAEETDLTIKQIRKLNDKGEQITIQKALALGLGDKELTDAQVFVGGNSYEQ